LGDSGHGVEYPAASQYMTAIGGTSLTLNANNTFKSATVWSGSGCSAYEPNQLGRRTRGACAAQSPM
jgi:subtilase family serine protease